MFRYAILALVAIVTACSARPSEAELISVEDFGEPVFAADITGLSTEGHDLLISLSPTAHARLEAYCDGLGDASVLIEAAGCVPWRGTGCDGLEPQGYRLHSSAHFGSPMPDHLANLIALQAPGSVQPVLTVYAEAMSLALGSEALSVRQWRVDGAELTLSRQMREKLQTLDTSHGRWMIIREGEVLGGLTRVDVSPDTMIVRTQNAPAMEAWRASLGD